MRHLNKIFTTTFILFLILILGVVNNHVLAQGGTWTTKAPMSTLRTGPTGGVINDQFYVVSGQTIGGAITSVEAYNPATNTWIAKASIPTGRAYAGAGVIAGKLYVVGGCIGSDCIPGLTNILEMYDPVTNTWTTKAPMPTPRTTMAVGVIDGKLYVAGGMQQCGPCIPLATLEVYDPTSDTWVTRAPMPTARSHTSGVVINDQFYVVGGTNNGGFSGLGTIETYDPIANTWATKASMPTARFGVAVGEINGTLYAASGGSTTIVEGYNPALNTWSTIAPIPTARYLPAFGVINGVLYVAGSGSGNVPINTVEAFTPTPCISSTSSTTVVACDHYLWNGVDYTTSGDKTFTTTNTAGCDSVATLHLTIVNHPIVNAGNDEIVFFGNSAVQALGCITLTANVSGGSEVGSNFNWTSLPVSSIQNSTGNQITVCPIVNTTYTVTYTTSTGCIATDNVLVKAIDVSCGNNNNKVKICITTPSGQQNTICVASSSVPAVLASNPNAELGDCSAYNSRIANTITSEVVNNGLKVYPNPSSNYFILKFENNFTDQKISLRIFDFQGKLIETRNNISSDGIIQIGNKYNVGVYIAEIRQGNQRKVIKLVKL